MVSLMAQSDHKLLRSAVPPQETVPQAGSERPESRKALDRCPDIEKDMRLANTCKSLWPLQKADEMGPRRQPTTETCFALARLAPTCLLPTIVKDLSLHHSRNLTSLLGQLV
ncbi:hypothetical protein RDI58_014306 [Solanum bulbocastanum]|uniref:Uncharacterized protein n=1 Tax=Solanum bulbocastanum TaxID=147425 RepID=A0AAN8SPA6_SOLBU